MSQNHVEFMHLEVGCRQVSACLCTDMLYDIIPTIGTSDQFVGWLKFTSSECISFSNACRASTKIRIQKSR